MFVIGESPNISGFPGIASRENQHPDGGGPHKYMPIMFLPMAISRSPSSALSHPFFGWEGSPTKIDKQEKQSGTHLFQLLKSGGPSRGPKTWGTRILPTVAIAWLTSSAGRLQLQELRRLLVERAGPDAQKDRNKNPRWAGARRPRRGVAEVFLTKWILWRQKILTAIGLDL